MVGLAGFKLNQAVASYLSKAPSPSPKNRTKSTRARRGHERLSNQQANEIVRLYRQGMSARQIAADLHVGRTTVLELLARRGETKRWRRFTAAETARIVELYEQGMAQTEIAAQFGRGPSAVWWVLRRAGLVGARR